MLEHLLAGSLRIAIGDCGRDLPMGELRHAKARLALRRGAPSGIECMHEPLDQPSEQPIVRSSRDCMMKLGIQFHPLLNIAACGLESRREGTDRFDVRRRGALGSTRGDRRLESFTKVEKFRGLEVAETRS